MPKTQVIPCSKEEIEKIVELSLENDFYYMIFNVLKSTGRRIGELHGTPKKVKVGEKIVGKKTISIDGKDVAIDVKRAIYKKIPHEYVGGVQVKDLDLNEGLMKVWVLKRRKLIQDETVLTREVIRLIKHYIAKYKLKEEDYLFRGKCYRAIQDAVTNYAKKAEIDHKVSVHNFRHYFVTHLKKKGWTNDKISKLTGHKDSKNLDIYDHVVAKDIKDDAIKDLEDI